ncbi:MAG: alpha/beta fold hydrolase [Mucilaginibacter sp.]
MKIFKIIVIVVLFLTCIATAILATLYIKRNKEKKVLTDFERKGTPGNYIKLSQGTTHYELAGPDTGKMVVLIHGFSVPYYIWDGTFEYLVSHGFKVLRYDTYGRGYSDRPEAIYNQDMYTNQLHDLIKSLHIKVPLTLTGVSFGGAIATTFTCKYPGLVNKVILIDPVYNKTPPTEPQFLNKFYAITNEKERPKEQLTDFKYPQLHPDWAGKYIVQMRYKGFISALISTNYNYSFLGNYNYTQLNNLHKPVLLIWGKEDHTVPFNYSDSIRKVLTTVFFPVDDSGHLPHLEQSRKVNARLLQFLKQ